MLTRLVLISTLWACLFPWVARAGSWTLDKDHTEVRFSWDHLGLSRQGASFRDVEGKLEFELERPADARVAVTIPMKSLSTGVAKLDEHLLGTKDFFDVSAYPVITFKSTSVTLKSDRTLDVAGDLTINGVTQPAVLDVIWNFAGEHPMANINPTYQGVLATGFSAKTQIRRSDWGIKRTIPYVSDEIRISIETEALRQAPAPAVESTPATGEAPASAESSTAGSAAGPSIAAPLLGGEAVVAPQAVPAADAPEAAPPPPAAPVLPQAGTAVEMEPLPPPPGAPAAP